MHDIVLATLNARYIHASFGLRYLKANLKELEAKTALLEFTIDQRPLDIAEQLLAHSPRIIGLGVYIWNCTQTEEVAKLLKVLAPEVTLVLGGPEVSYEQTEQSICALADHVLSGPAEAAFYELCHNELNGLTSIEGFKVNLSLSDITLPYHLYTDEDLVNRILYVEASRGCPFKCEFCLSALDKTAKPFALDRFLEAMGVLYDRGARNFKFVDRTFNLSSKVSVPIMQFFLGRMAEDLFVHFEVIPDRLPDALKKMIAQFPAGSLQFEVGIQTFNPAVQTLISRKQDNDKTLENLGWLCGRSPAYIHTDLIFGLPSEALKSCADNFDKLVKIGPDEIQLGILKRLRGMPMIRLEQPYQLRFNPNPPYEILSTSTIDFAQMQSLRRFARYWDLVGNAGRFKSTLPLLLGDRPFERFMRFSEWLHATTGQTHKIGLKRLFDLLFSALSEVFNIPSEQIIETLEADYQISGSKGLPQCLVKQQSQHNRRTKRGQNKRQLTHLLEN
ncbi:MAG: hypothetical protein ACI9J2_001323 [Saprospiraceae bacterium]|jgi:hypothetical protein